MPTVAVTGSQIVMTAGGATALALTTRNGTVAFVLTLETIAGLRTDLDHAETLLDRFRYGHGQITNIDLDAEQISPFRSASQDRGGRR